MTTMVKKSKKNEAKREEEGIGGRNGNEDNSWTQVVPQVVTAVALMFEHGRILECPTTYEFMARGQMMEGIWSGSYLMEELTNLQRWCISNIGVERWCTLILLAASALLLSANNKNPTIQRRAATALVWMRVTWLGIHDGNCTQPSDSYVIWTLLVVWALGFHNEEKRANGGDDNNTTSRCVLRSVLLGAYLSGAAGYVASGVLKWRSASWRSGRALRLLADGPTARPLLSCGESLVRRAVLAGSVPLTLGAMAFEAVVFPVCVVGGCVVRWGGWGDGWGVRRGGLVLSMVMHASLLVLIDVPWISLYMLANHIVLWAADVTLLPVQPNKLSKPSKTEISLTTALACIILVSPACTILSCYDTPRQTLHTYLSHAFRRTGISPLTITGYEQPPSPNARTGFEPYSFSSVKYTLHTAPRATPFAYYCATDAGGGGGCGAAAAASESSGWPTPALLRNAEGSIVEKRRGGVVSLTGITAESPGTQHHQLVLLGLLMQERGGYGGRGAGGAVKHRVLCAGGDAYGLHEARLVRSLFGVDGEDEVLVGISYTVYNPMDDSGDGDDDGRLGRKGGLFAHIDCRHFWSSSGLGHHFDEGRLVRHTGHTIGEARLLLSSLSSSSSSSMEQDPCQGQDTSNPSCSAPCEILTVRRLDGSAVTPTPTPTANQPTGTAEEILWTDLIQDRSNEEWHAEIDRQNARTNKQDQYTPLTCKWWANHGECHKSASFMKEWCAGSCAQILRQKYSQKALARCAISLDSAKGDRDIVFLHNHHDVFGDDIIQSPLPPARTVATSPFAWMLLPLLVVMISIPWAGNRTAVPRGSGDTLQSAVTDSTIPPVHTSETKQNTNKKRPTALFAYAIAITLTAVVLIPLFFSWNVQDIIETDDDRRGVVVVTGAGSGIGRDISLELLRRGHTVIATVRSADSADALVRRVVDDYPRDAYLHHDSGNSDGGSLYGGGDKHFDAEALKAVRTVKHSNGGALITQLLDLSPPQQQCSHNQCYDIWNKQFNTFADTVRSIRIHAATNTKTTQRGGYPLLGIIHAAGTVPNERTLTHLSLHKTLLPTFHVNLFAPLLLTRALLPQLIETHGRIALLGSMAAFWAGPSQITYAASKAALEAAADALRRSLKSKGVSVSIVEPGSIGGGESKMCSVSSVCNVSPRNATTPVLLHALFADRPRARYAVGPVSAPVWFAFGRQIPASFAMMLARPVPDFVLDFILGMFPSPIHKN